MPKREGSVRPRILVLFFALGSLATGCDKIGRVRECRALIQAVNQAMDGIEALGHSDRPELYRKASKRYSELAKTVRQLPVTPPAGQAAKEEYALSLEALAPMVQLYAEALDAKGLREQAEARRDIERAGRRERQAAAHVDSYCRTP